MLHTPVCELFGIEHPIMQAAIAPFTSPELAAAVANAGGLGSLGTALRPLEQVLQDITRLRELTSRPFAVNFTASMVDDAAFDAVLQTRPPFVSFALGDPGERVRKAHDQGIRFIQQVHTVTQAKATAERGVDALIAQGTEAGGFGGTVSTMPLVPQVVEAVAPLPVLAAGGIADGRGLAAALVLGAQGINIGTRFLASAEAPTGEAWKQGLVAAAAEDAVKVDVMNDIFPPATGVYETVPRALRTAFVDEWQGRHEEARREAAHLRGELIAAVQQGRMHDYVPFSGQTAGAIHEILPAAEIVRRLVAEAEAALDTALRLRA